MTTTALDGIPAAPPAEPVGWHLAAHVVFPDVHEPDILPLYVEYGARAPRIDDAYDRWERGWGEYKGIEATEHRDTENRIGDVTSRRSIRVRAGERLSLATYFNAFPVSYWRRWTDVQQVRLVAQVRGSATVMVYRSNAKGAPVRVATLATGAGESPAETVTPIELDLDLRPFVDGGWYWFDVVGGPADAELVEADWFVRGVPQRPARLSIGVTTVNKVDYVERLVSRIAGEPELRDHLDTVFIVDQGTEQVTSSPTWAQTARTLGSQLTVITQANLGGSGGFSRGMWETLRAGTSTFHMVLDDDVDLEPEGILRAVRFGSFTSTAAIVGAHMFDLHNPTTLHSFGEVVDPIRWVFGPVRGVHEEWDLAARGLRQTPWLHRRTDVTYNGWWMCLIPTEVLEAVGLSLPVFIKWDDAEHCLRAGAAGYPTITLPGAAVWHISWNDKDDAWEWQAYFHQRNLLISALLHSREPRGGQVVAQSFQWLLKHGYSMRYYANAIRLRALQDLFLGPQALHPTLASTLPELRALAADYPDAQPRPRQADFPAPTGLLGGPLPSIPPRSRLVPWSLRTGIRHLSRTRAGAADAPEIAVPSRYAVWWFLSQFDSALVSKMDGSGTAFFRRDPAVFRSQLAEGMRLHARLFREWDELAAQYRQALPDLVSPQAWARTFGIEPPDNHETDSPQVR